MSLVAADTLARNALLRRVWSGLGKPRCYVAGGFLRDYLLGRRTADIDLSLPATVDQVAAPARRLAASLGTRAHLLGRPPRCVWRVEAPGAKVELWPLGELSLDEDIRRRDFSCNALMWELPGGPLIDRVGGLEDLEQRRLRALSSANLRDDPVRLLRAARFLAQHPGFVLDDTTADWIRELAPRLAEAPRSRIGQELLLILNAPAASRGLETALELGLLKPMLPAEVVPDAPWIARHLSAADRLASPRRHPVAGALAEAGDSARLSLLLRGWGAPDAEIVSVYGWPRSDRRLAARAARLLDLVIDAVDAPANERRELIHVTGAAFPAALAVAAALDGTASAWRRWWRQWQRGGDELVNPRALLSADELATTAGVAEGPELGRLLRDLQRAQVRGDVRSRSGARRWLRRRLLEEAE